MIVAEPLDNIMVLCGEHATKPNPALHQAPLESYAGFYVKRGFQILNGEGTEHMWVRVTGNRDGLLVGTLNNDPLHNVGYVDGDQVTFAVTDIEDMLPPV